MAKKNNKKGAVEKSAVSRLHPETRKSIWAISLTLLAVIFVLAEFQKAGLAGSYIYKILEYLLGWGYLVLPLVFFFTASVLLFSERQEFIGFAPLGAIFILLSVLGLIDLIAPGKGGVLGSFSSSGKYLFGEIADFVINAAILLIAILATLNVPLKFKLPEKKRGEQTAYQIPIMDSPPAAAPEKNESSKKLEGAVDEDDEEGKSKMNLKVPAILKQRRQAVKSFSDYVPPPLEILKSSSEKPTTGDLRANANIIKRTLESFGITVEMGEISVGPKVTRYTLKPAEGMKLSRITALSQDLALALAAHPIRIEAPIPGKSLVGVEVPNKAAALVRLGSLMAYPEFSSSGLLGFALGRDVTGEPVFTDLEKMPHLLISGATGSGKSIMVHSLIISALYKNSPSTLKLILIDPKRVELSIYEGLPHLISPVITENKKAISVFRWAIQEMDRRYDLLQAAGSRDIKSYNLQYGNDPLPYIVIIIDELADLMTSYGREVEGSIVRLAQMARATGLHLVLSTQRPSVEIITGLIKANITSRIALQVASQIDSRTILDTSGAEKLLGGGDLLFISSELSKPKRIQGAYVSEDETKKVADFIREHNLNLIPETEEIAWENGNGSENSTMEFEDFPEGDDELYEKAVEIVRQAQKASASLLQRRLKVGYARAARLLDMMEEKGVIGPGEGAKPREVFLEKDSNF